jgi:hypothetical protein
MHFSRFRLLFPKKNHEAPHLLETAGLRGINFSGDILFSPRLQTQIKGYRIKKATTWLPFSEAQTFVAFLLQFFMSSPLIFGEESYVSALI